MKDLILISAYCETFEKKEKLRLLTMDLDKARDRYDIMIVAHSIIPEDIVARVDYYLYDKKNELLTDWDLRNMPWFNPGDQRKILSIFTAKYSTHLAIWRMLILGNGIAERLGYTKIHHIEYDARIPDPSVLDLNSKRLDEVNVVTYQIDQDDILFGSYQCYRIGSIDRRLIELDEEWIKDQIRRSPEKSPERMLHRMLVNGGHNIIRHRSELEVNGNRFGTSHESPGLAWCLPFYDRIDDRLKFITWNKESKSDVEVCLIYNGESVWTARVSPGFWNLIDLGPYHEAHSLISMVNGNIRERFDFDRDRDAFMRASYREDCVS